MMPVRPSHGRGSYSLFIFAAICLLLSVTAYAQYSAPRIFFSDLQSGPGTGGLNNLGTIVTIYGQGFGATQGTSVVTVGGVPAASYLAWSNTKVSFQPGPAATSGNIVVEVAGVGSNAVPFTVRSGNLYFVSPGGNDSNSGSYSSPWLTLVHAAGAMVPGDVTYAMNGVTQTALDVNSTSLVMNGSGSTGLPLAIVAYPGALVTVGSATGQTYGISSSASQWVLAGLTVTGNTSALSLTGSAVWRVVGNDFSCPNGSGTAACVQATNVTGIQLLGNNIHDNGSTTSTNVQGYNSLSFSGASNALEVGWNNVVRTRSCRGMLFSVNGPNQFLLNVHDNFIQNAVCSGISFANVDPYTSTVAAYNNVISHVGTGPAPGGVEAGAYACITVGGSSVSAVVIANNTLYDCGARENANSGAIVVAVPVTLADNIFDVLSGESYFSANSVTSGVVGSNNLLYGDGSAPSFLSASIVGDPGFVSIANSNFQLQSGSPAIDAGIPDFATWDFNGVPRPQGNGYDIGAFEYSSSASGQIVISPSSVSFGNVNVGASSTQTVTISNSGTGNATVSAVSSGPGFTLNGLTLPLTLAPEQAASFTATFAPSAAGSAAATVSFTSNAANSPATLAFSGTGVNPVGQLTANPDEVALSNVVVGSSTSQTITVTASIAPVTISQATTSGSGFNVTGPTLPLMLAAGQSASFTVSYYAAIAGYQTGMFTVLSNASNTVSLPIWVTGTAPAAQLAASPSSLTFGNVTTGASASQTVTVTAVSASVTISQASLMGTGFTFTGSTLPITLAAGQSASFTVKFAPTAAGSSTGTLSLTSSASSAPTVALSGTGVNPVGQLAASPSSLTFGNVATGASASQAVAVTASTASVTISQATLTGAGFTFTGPTLPLTLTAGQTASFTLIFAPSAAGSSTGYLSLTSNASSTPTIALSGTGVNPVGQLTASPSSLTFGNVTTGTSTSQTVTVTASTASVTISQATLTGTGFTFTGPTLPLTLAAGQATSFTVKFAPTAAGSSTGTFSLTSNASSTPTVALSGTGVNPVGQLAASPSSLAFGNVTTGTSASQTFTVTASTASVTISQAALTGTGFTFTGPTLPLTLAAGQATSFAVKFAPTAAGSSTGTFSLTSNASSTPAIALSGTGVNPAGQLAASPSSLAFGNVNTGASASQTVTVTASTASVTISQATLTGTGFTFTGPTLPLTLTAGQTASFTLTFAPTAAGSFTGTFSLTSNASSTPAVALSGTGVNSVGQLAVNPSQLNFGTTTAGSSSSQTVTLTASTGSVTISQATINGPGFSFSGLTLPLTLAAGQSTSFTLTFSSTVSGYQTGVLSLVSNASNSVSISMWVTNNASSAQLSASASSLSFGNVTMGTSPSQTVTVTASAASVSISQATISGAGFTFTGPALPLTLAAGQTATFTVKFAPTATGSVTGSFSLTSNASTSNIAIALSGTGTASIVHSVTLSWSPSKSTDVVGYYVFRATQSGGPYTQINATALSAMTYTDSSVVGGTTYYYVTTAVDNTGLQSGYSDQTVATVPTP